MEMLALWASALLLVVLIGAVLGWVGFFRARDLGERLARLEQELVRLREGESAGSQTEQTQAVLSTESMAVPTADFPPQADTLPPQQSDMPPPPPSQPRKPGLFAHLVKNWMIWMGGLCVGLAGIFMVKYSIDAGLLGPQARIALALASGIALHGAAEWLRRRGGSDPSFAALAGGASITLYGALLAALHLYQLLDPRLIFALLALVSVLTMALALVHGPVLAAIGILGAYVVPILVSDNSGNVIGALVYSLIISAAALLLLRQVFRPWLWWGMVAGALGWWLVSLTSHQSDNFRGIYLALLAWGVVAIPAFDWLLNRGDSSHTQPGAHIKMLFGRPWRLDQLTLFLIIFAWGYSIQQQGFGAQALAQWAPLVLVLGFAARQRHSLGWLPWLSLGVQWLAWLATALTFDYLGNRYQLVGIDPGLQLLFLQFTGFMALLYTGLALLHLRAKGFSHRWASLAFVSPLAWLALSYLLVSELTQSLAWSVAVLMVGLVYGFVAAWRLEKYRGDGAAIWFILGGHFAYSLAAGIYFREAGLTLALAAQLLSLAWVMRRYDLPWLAPVIKAVLALVVIRFTLNPWLASYPVDVHWSLWSGGGATLFCALAAWQSRASPGLNRWLEAATLHLLVLTLGAEVRYWLYDGNIFAERYSLTEAAINTSLWAAMALTYWYRADHSEQLGVLYRNCSRILLILATGSYALAVTTLNPLWSSEVVSPRPIANLLLLAYGLPVVMALLVAWRHDPRWRRTALAVAGAGLLLFVSLEIRHLWQGKLALYLATGNGELYTYSVVWLLLAAAAIVAGGLWRYRGLYRAGMALLAVVIAKLFLVDMSDLDGLWRVASFMGLGLSLLGLAWLHRRIGHAGAATTDPEPA